MGANGRTALHAMRALRVRLVAFFAAVLTAALLLFGGTVYVAAVLAEAAEQEPESEKQRELAHIRRLLALAFVTGIPITLGAALLGARLLSHHALESVGRIVRTANTLTLDHLDARLTCQPGSGREIEELVDALNAMLDRIAHSARSLRRFTADAAHELRTPIAVISSELEVCLRYPRDPDTLRATLGAALEGLGNLSRLVDVLLTLVRSDAGELPIAPTHVDPAGLISQIAAPFDCVAAERSLRLCIALPDPTATGSPGIPALHTDPLLLGRALANLIDHACKYATAGGVITVALRPLTGAVQILVSDNGPGMSAQDLARACDRFYRGSAHRGSTEGFGLGLSLTHEFMRSLGGTLTIASAHPVGLVATLTLPTAPKPTESSAPPRTHASAILSSARR